MGRYRISYDPIIVAAKNRAELQKRVDWRLKVGDIVNIPNGPREVDMRPWAGLREVIGDPYPDEP